MNKEPPEHHARPSMNKDRFLTHGGRFTIMKGGCIEAKQSFERGLSGANCLQGKASDAKYPRPLMRFTPPQIGGNTDGKAPTDRLGH